MRRKGMGLKERMVKRQESLGRQWYSRGDEREGGGREGLRECSLAMASRVYDDEVNMGR